MGFFALFPTRVRVILGRTLLHLLIPLFPSQVGVILRIGVEHFGISTLPHAGGGNPVVDLNSEGFQHSSPRE